MFCTYAGNFRKNISGDNETSEGTSEAQFVDYYNHFPLEFDQVPLFWSSCEVSELLEGSYLIQLIEERKVECSIFSSHEIFDF